MEVLVGIARPAKKCIVFCIVDSLKEAKINYSRR